MSDTARHRLFSAERRFMERHRPGAGAEAGPNAMAEAPAPADGTVDTQMLLDAINGLRAEVQELKGQIGAQPPSEDHEAEISHEVRIEIAQMVRSIGRAKAEIAAIKHPMADDDRMMSASGELDAIVLATETATQDILAANERIETAINKIAAMNREDDEIGTLTDKIAADLITILESCNFQDITGQRINKVIKTLRFVEDRILAMIGIWGIEAFSDLPIPDDFKKDGDPEDEATLLNGPQLGNMGLTQADIDALFD